MTDGDADRRAQRHRVLARIEQDREQLAGTLDELRRPLHKLQHLQKNVRALVPALFAAGAAFLILRALRGSNGRRIGMPVGGHRAAYLAVREPRRRSWFATVLQMVSAYRTAVLLSETLRSVSDAASARPPMATAPSAPPVFVPPALVPPAGRSYPPFERKPT
ncbi:MAG: hypothetical protein Q8M37_07740 [Nevskia sp.]|nr:hypothetical protein [Nevskia sp.]